VCSLVTIVAPTSRNLLIAEGLTIIAPNHVAGKHLKNNKIEERTNNAHLRLETFSSSVSPIIAEFHTVRCGKAEEARGPPRPANNFSLQLDEPLMSVKLNKTLRRSCDKFASIAVNFTAHHSFLRKKSRESRSFVQLNKIPLRIIVFFSFYSTLY
jgi:hypothetical protein